jgi:hypothetical protein
LVSQFFGLDANKGDLAIESEAFKMHEVVTLMNRMDTEATKKSIKGVVKHQGLYVE